MSYSRLPSLLALRAYEAVARNGSMKKASEELHVTPGAVSQLVKKLEDQLEVDLLVRVNRGFELTEAGGRLNAGLAEAFNKMQEAVNSAKPNVDSRSILVACGPPFAAKWLVPRLHKFLLLYPDIDIKITSSFMLQDYNAKEIDIGIRLSNDDDPSLEHIWLGEETMTVMGAPDFIRRHNIECPKDIIGLSLLSEDTSNHFVDAPTWDDWFKNVGLPNAKLKRGINFGEYVEQALDAAAAGAGLVLGRKVLASNDISQGKLQCLFGKPISTGLRYQVVFRKESSDKPPVNAFKDWLVNELNKSIKLDISAPETQSAQAENSAPINAGL